MTTPANFFKAHYNTFAKDYEGNDNGDDNEIIHWNGQSCTQISEPSCPTKASLNVFGRGEAPLTCAIPTPLGHKASIAYHWFPMADDRKHASWPDLQSRGDSRIRPLGGLSPQ